MIPPFVSHNMHYVNYDGIMELWHYVIYSENQGIL